MAPDTILRWHHELVAKKWDHSDKRKTVGRPRIRPVIVDSMPKCSTAKIEKLIAE